MKSCPSAGQHSSARHPPKEPASPCSWQPMALSPSSRIVARLSGAVPSKKKFPAFHDTHPSCQRQAKTGQPIVVLPSLAWLAPTTHTTSTTSASLFAQIGSTRRSTRIIKVCYGGLPTIKNALLRAHAPGHPNCHCTIVLGPSPSTRRCRVGWGQAVAVQLRNSMELPLPPSPPPPPGRRPPQPSRFIPSLIPRYRPRDSPTAARCRFRDGSAFPGFETRPSSPPGLLKSQAAAASSRNNGPARVGYFSFLQHVMAAHPVKLLDCP